MMPFEKPIAVAPPEERHLLRDGGGPGIPSGQFKEPRSIAGALGREAGQRLAHIDLTRRTYEVPAELA
jgi:hypothetical protein